MSKNVQQAQLLTFNARSRVPVGFLDELKNQRNFLDILAKRLHIKQPEDWYQVK